MPTVREDRNSGEGPIYYYDPAIVPIPDIELRGFRFTQKMKNMDVVYGSAHDLDRLCQVPYIDNDQSNEDVSNILGAGGVDRWQRKSDSTRINNISAFWEAPADNYMANAAVISLPDEPDYVVNAHGGVVGYNIAVNWAVSRCPDCRWQPAAGTPRNGWQFDACASCEWCGRPGKIIDGQHRISGCAKSAGQRDEHLITTILHPTMINGFVSAQQAKIFTEITTGAKPLDSHHQIALLRLFNLEGTKAIVRLPKPDFRLVPAAVPPVLNTLADRNNRAYQVALALNDSTQPSAPWNNSSGRLTMIKLSGGKDGRGRPGDVLEVDYFTYKVAHWLNDGPLADLAQADGMMTRVQCRDALSNYMTAILATWPGAPHWNPGRGANGLLQQRGIFEVLFDLFSVIATRLRAGGYGYGLAEFTNQLSYLSNILWPVWQTWGSPDKNKTMMHKSIEHFYAWLDFRGIIDPAATAPPTILAPGINAWTGVPPDPISAVTVTDDAGGAAPASWFATSAAGTPKLRFSWGGACTNAITGMITDKPINCYQNNATVTIEQLDAAGNVQVLYQEDVRGTQIKLNWADLSGPIRGAAGGGAIELVVVYKNHVAPMNSPVSMVPPG